MRLQAIKAHVEAEKALLADSINSGPMAELQVNRGSCIQQDVAEALVALRLTAS
jgi:hypothetical protein